MIMSIFSLKGFAPLLSLIILLGCSAPNRANSRSDGLSLHTLEGCYLSAFTDEMLMHAVLHPVLSAGEQNRNSQNYFAETEWFFGRFQSDQSPADHYDMKVTHVIAKAMIESCVNTGDAGQFLPLLKAFEDGAPFTAKLAAIELQINAIGSEGVETALEEIISSLDSLQVQAINTFTRLQLNYVRAKATHFSARMTQDVARMASSITQYQDIAQQLSLDNKDMSRGYYLKLAANISELSALADSVTFPDGAQKIEARLEAFDQAFSALEQSLKFSDGPVLTALAHSIRYGVYSKLARQEFEVFGRNLDPAQRQNLKLSPYHCKARQSSDLMMVIMGNMSFSEEVTQWCEL